jgi:pantoate kinase
VALVKVRHSLDASGKTIDVRVISEIPAGQGFGEAAARAIRSRLYLPAYRNGKPTACAITFEFRVLENY